MKSLAILLVLVGVTACGQAELASKPSKTMQLSRTYTGAGDRCTGEFKWLECRTQKTPAEANGGGGD